MKVIPKRGRAASLFILIALSLFATAQNSIAAAPISSSYSYTFVGSTSTYAVSLTSSGWTEITPWTACTSGTIDDCLSGNILPSGFKINFNGNPYQYLNLTTNSVICFTPTCTTAYSGFAGNVPPSPGVQICASDYDAVHAYYKYTAASNIFQIRYEGVAHNASQTTPTAIWEATFHDNGSAFELGVGVEGQCSVSSHSGFVDGTNTGYLGYFKTAVTDTLTSQGFQVTTVPISTISLTTSPSSAVYRTATQLQVIVNTAGKVTFYQQGKPIPGCKGVATSVVGPNIVANCSWKPSIHGSPSLKAALTPANSSYSGSTTYPVNVPTSSRSTTR